MSVRPERPKMGSKGGQVPKTPPSNNELRALARSLDAHRRLLGEVQRESAWYLRERRELTYVVDFELLWRWITADDQSLATYLEVDYLFAQDSVHFKIGLGTHQELWFRLAQIAEIDLTSTAFKRATSFNEFLNLQTAAGGEYSSRRLEDLVRSRHRERNYIERLDDLLCRTNWQFAPLEHAPDRSAFQRALAALRRLRPGASRNNFADALNVAQVVAARGHVGAEYPFLLTTTGALLDDELSRHVVTGGYGVVREPGTVIYSCIAGTIYPDAAERMQRMSELDWMASVVLRQWSSSGSPASGRAAARKGRPYRVAGQGVRPESALSALYESAARFVSDPLIDEAHRIYTSLQKAPAAPRPPATVDSLFRVIRRTSERLEPNTVRFDDLWRESLRHVSEQRSSYRVHSFYDASDAWAMTLEVHDDMFVCRWPLARSPEALLQLYSSAFLRHAERDVTIFAGTEDEVYRLEAELPVAFKEVVEACGGSSVNWVRIEGDAFSLYGDTARSVAYERVAGLVGAGLDWEHVAEIVRLTSPSRGPFFSWVRGALASAAEGELD